jgi:hypothetical protein
MNKKENLEKFSKLNYMANKINKFNLNPMPKYHMNKENILYEENSLTS